MSRSRLALLALAAVTAAAGIHLAWSWADLPDRIPTHFSAGGHPDAWQDRTTFGWTWGATLLGTALMLLGTGVLMGRVDVRWMSLPHRDYWLDVGRRRATVDDLQTRIWGFGALTMALLLDLQVQMIGVARGGADALTHFGLTMLIYLGATLVWTVALLVHYGRKPAA